MWWHHTKVARLIDGFPMSDWPHFFFNVKLNNHILWENYIQGARTASKKNTIGRSPLFVGPSKRACKCRLLTRGGPVEAFISFFSPQKSNTVHHSCPQAFPRACMEVSDSDNLQRENDWDSRSESTLWNFQNNVLRFDPRKRSRFGHLVLEHFFSFCGVWFSYVGKVSYSSIFWWWRSRTKKVWQYRGLDISQTLDAT